MNKLKIESLTIKHMLDEYPDTSFLGEFTDDMEPGIIVRDYGEFYEKLPSKMERDYDGKFIGKSEPEIPQKGREYRGFLPYAGGEKAGTKNYYRYGMQDHERMEGLNRGDWYFMGIMVEAKVSYPSDSFSSGRSETFTSDGLWGIESDSKNYLKEIEKEQLDDLKIHLKKFNIDISNFDNIKIGRME